MKQINNTIRKKNSILFGALGYLIALALIATLILSVNQPKPEWGDYWYIRPLIITPFFGAFGGVGFYFLTTFQTQKAIIKLFQITLSIIVFIFFLWIGTILGLDGTLWD